MTTIERRLDALETATATDTDKLLLLFVSWTRSKEAPVRRLKSEWKGEQFSQSPGESEECFKDRLRSAVNRNRPAANCAAVVFLSEMDMAL